MRLALIVPLLILPFHAFASPETTVKTVVEEHILPGFSNLTERSNHLASVAEADCSPTSEALIDAYGSAFDAWVEVSHLRFGPTEADNRAFALAYWPDPRGKTPKSLARLTQDKDPVVFDAEAFNAISIAARGFYALEQLFYGPAGADDAAYTCELIKAVTKDIASTSAAISNEWSSRYADLLMNAEGGKPPYILTKDAVRELYKTLLAGLQFTYELRLGRPLGTFDKPRPRLAEARLSGRSLRHVLLSLESTERLMLMLASEHPDARDAGLAAYGAAYDAARRISDPAFQTVSNPIDRIRIEALQQRVEAIRDTIRDRLGPALGVDAGFNALDGD